MRKTKQKAQETNKHGPTHERRTTQKGKKHTKNKKQKKKKKNRDWLAHKLHAQFHVHISQVKKTESWGETKKTKKIKTAFLLATKITCRSKTKIHTRISNKYNHRKKQRKTKTPSTTSAKRRRRQQHFFLPGEAGRGSRKCGCNKRKR
jgi:hypothetical protein